MLAMIFMLGVMFATTCISDIKSHPFARILPYARREDKHKPARTKPAGGELRRGELTEMDVQLTFEQASKILTKLVQLWADQNDVEIENLVITKKEDGQLGLDQQSTEAS